MNHTSTLPATPEHEELSPAFERQTLAKVRLYLLTYIILGQVFYALCRTNIGFAQLTMGKELGLKAEAFGFASGVFGFSGFLMQVPAGLLFEKYKARRWMTFNMAAWGMVVVSQGFVHSGLQLTLLRFLLGVFEAGFLPGVYILIATWFRGRDHGTAQSWVMMGLGISAVIGNPFAGWILGRHFWGFAGWRWLFIIEGAATVILSLAALLVLYDEPSSAPWLNARQQRFMVNYLSDYEESKNHRGALHASGMWSTLKDQRIILLLISFACTGWVAGTFAFFYPSLLKMAGKGISNQYVGFLAMGPYVLSAIAAFFWGRHADKTGERHWHCTLPCLVCAGGLLLYPIAKTPVLAMLSLALVQVGNSSFIVNFWASCHMVVGKQTITKSTSLIVAGMLLFAFLGPIFFGRVIDKTGKPLIGLFTCVFMMMVTFVLMNVFFIRYKAQQSMLMTTA